MMPHSIEDIHEALIRIHSVAMGRSERAYMSISADRERDADLILSAAIKELEELRTSRDTPTAEVARLTAENTKLRSAIKQAGFDVCQTSGDWTIHDVSTAAKIEEEKTLLLINQNIELEREVKRLQAFKDWVHKYLNDKGVPTNPDGPHSKEGCRIGDRMDWVFAKLQAVTEHSICEFARDHSWFFGRKKGQVFITGLKDFMISQCERWRYVVAPVPPVHPSLESAADAFLAEHGWSSDTVRQSLIGHFAGAVMAEAVHPSVEAAVDAAEREYLSDRNLLGHADERALLLKHLSGFVPGSGAEKPCHKCVGHCQHIESLERERKDHLEKINFLTQKSKGEYWVWQGDGSDHLESLTCPVLIRANDLRKLLADKPAPVDDRERCAKWLENYSRDFTDGNTQRALRGAATEMRNPPAASTVQPVASADQKRIPMWVATPKLGGGNLLFISPPSDWGGSLLIKTYDRYVGEFIGVPEPPTPPDPPAVEPVPEGVWWDGLNFIRGENEIIWEGTRFYNKWHSRRSEFPQGPGEKREAIR